MAALVYLHGFLSSPQSAKAEQTRRWLGSQRPGITYHCPFLSSYPEQALQSLGDLVRSLEGEPIGLVGSSLGGFWATYLAEHYDLRAVLVNPAVRPQDRFGEFVGQTLRNYHTQDSCQLKQADLVTLISADQDTLRDPNRYWVLLQTGDETLDYRQALEKYGDCHLLVEEGGDHSFVGFERWLPDIVEFLFPQS
jgi:predicted esterase YcpF (UPF0227 family)